MNENGATVIVFFYFISWDKKAITYMDLSPLMRKKNPYKQFKETV
jgi:hypothetical protein